MSRFAFLSQNADRARIPVALLSGFLGSGKTTLVNALLRDPRMTGTAVAVNEFGAVPLDHDLIDHGADKTVVMANGCLCCNLAGDMEDAVLRLFSRRQGNEIPNFERLIIEPSGLADPAPIAQAILRNPLLSRAFRLETILSTVDALFAHTQLHRHPEVRKQIALADHLVLTKTDLVTTSGIAQLRTDLRAHNPAAPILVASHGQIDPASLFAPSFFDPAAPASAVPTLLFAESIDPGHTTRHAAAALTSDQTLQWRPFDDWLRRIRIGHADQLLRVKGILDIAEAAGPVVVQGVHHVLNAPVELDAWPPGKPTSRLVMIADPVTIAAVTRSWAEALPGMVVEPGRHQPAQTAPQARS